MFSFYDDDKDFIIDKESDKLSIFTKILPDEQDFVQQKIPLFGDNDHISIKDLLKLNKEEVFKEIEVKLEYVFKE